MMSPVPLDPDFVKISNVQFCQDGDFAKIVFDCEIDYRNLCRYFPKFIPHPEGEMNIISRSLEMSLAPVAG